MTTDRFSSPRPIDFVESPLAPPTDVRRSVATPTPAPTAQRKQVQITNYEGNRLDVDLRFAFTVGSRAEAELVGALVGEAIHEGLRVGWEAGWEAGLRASGDPATAALLPRQVVKVVERDTAGRVVRIVETNRL